MRSNCSLFDDFFTKHTIFLLKKKMRETFVIKILLPNTLSLIFLLKKKMREAFAVYDFITRH